MKVLTWIKEHALGILGAIVGFLALVLFVQRNRTKIKRLEAQAAVSSAKEKIAVADSRTEALKGKESALKAQDVSLERKIAEEKAALFLHEKQVGGVSREEVLKGLNNLYRLDGRKR